MKLFTKETRYAVRALAYIGRTTGSRNDGLVTVDQVAENEKIPRVFLRRLLQVLAKNGILISHKGKHGGFTLGKPVEEITMQDVIRIFQGEMDEVDCIIDGKNCGRTGQCALRHRMVDIHRKLEDEFSTITIASLL